MSHDVRDEVISGVLIVSNWKPVTWCGRAGKWRTKEVDLSWQKPAFIIPTMITVSHTSTGTSPEHKHNGAMTHTHTHIYMGHYSAHTHTSKPTVVLVRTRRLGMNRTGPAAPEGGWACWAVTGSTTPAGPSSGCWQVRRPTWRSCEVVDHRNLKVVPQIGMVCPNVDALNISGTGVMFFFF